MGWAGAKPGPGRDARGGGRSPGAAAGAPRGAARPRGPDPGRSSEGVEVGRAQRGGRPHPCSPEAGAAAVPQLLRRKLFRVTGAAVQGATVAGRGQERRARRVRGAGGGLRQLRGGRGERAESGASRLLRSRLTGATCCSRWLSLGDLRDAFSPGPGWP